MTTPLFSGSWEDPGVTFFGGNGAGGASCAEAIAFLARTSSLDATHRVAYGNLICGLVSDGVWSKLDMLHIYATQDSTTALLNLVSTSFNGTAFGSPTFTADRGFTGVDGSAIICIDLNFNVLTTAASALFSQNSAHMSAWSMTDIAANTGGIMGLQVPGDNYQSIIHPKFTDNKTYFRINTSSVGNAGVSNATTNAHFLGNRSSSSAIQGYKNGAVTLTDNATTSRPISGGNFLSLGFDLNSTPQGAAYQVGQTSLGGALTAGDVTNFYNRLRTYMTAVGVP